ncbi:hypothetical protein D3C85_1764450 [compost metagenome]
MAISSMPLPKVASMPLAPRSIAVPSSVCLTLSLLKNGNACHTSAAAPDICGAASEVPR